VPVTVGAPSGAGFVVVGIEPGAEIVATGGHLLREGQAVRRFTGLAAAEN
jgi:membrane fusion protein, multidrug efflux system